MKSKKVRLIAKVMDTIFINKIGLVINNKIHGVNYIRAVNYHGTPKENMEQFEKQMQYYKKHYTPVFKDDLRKLLDGVWDNEKPGLIISFDDGLESNYKYAKPILEKYGFPGWFFVPAGLIGTGYWEEQNLTDQIKEKYMNWEQVNQLSKDHIIGCHTLTHKRLKKELNQETLKTEIYDSKILLEDKLGTEIDVFCWVGGESDSYSTEASNLIKSSGYRYSFLTNHYPITKGTNPLKLERTNVESGWPIYLIKFYTSFFMDLKYSKKRKEIRSLLR